MRFINQCCVYIIVAFSLVLFPVQNAYAGTITGISVSETSLVTSATSTYTFTFTPPTTVSSATWCDGAYFWFNFDDDFTVSGATLGSITPPVSGMSINNKKIAPVKSECTPVVER